MRNTSGTAGPARADAVPGPREGWPGTYEGLPHVLRGEGDDGMADVMPFGFPTLV